MDELQKLAELINIRNEWEKQVAEIIGRPALIGHLGEYIASRIFDIQLVKSASEKGYDGHFINGKLAGKSVNIKWYSKKDRILDINPNGLPDYYLVLTGGDSVGITSKGFSRAWLIKNIYLFDANVLINDLFSRKIRIGIATSLSAQFWSNAEIYPVGRNQTIALTDQQKEMIKMFE